MVGNLVPPHVLRAVDVMFKRQFQAGKSEKLSVELWIGVLWEGLVTRGSCEVSRFRAVDNFSQLCQSMIVGNF